VLSDSEKGFTDYGLWVFESHSTEGYHEGMTRHFTKWFHKNTVLSQLSLGSCNVRYILYSEGSTLEQKECFTLQNPVETDCGSLYGVRL